MLSAAPSVGDYAAMSAGDLEVGHHAGRVVFEDVAVVHPASRAVVGEPGDADLSPLAGMLMVSSQDRNAGNTPLMLSTWKKKLQNSRILPAGCPSPDGGLQTGAGC
jgi:hypothetical protein